MPLPDELITSHLDQLLGSSDPGDCLHQLHVVAAPADAFGPLGVPPEDRLKTSIYAIAADTKPGVSTEEFIGKVIGAAAVEHVTRQEVVLFAALRQEMNIVSLEPGDDAGRVEAKRLASEGRLKEHPDAAEVTVVYGVCTDGRRWQGMRWLTGPKAGTSKGFDVLTGPSTAREGYAVACAGMMRMLVGMPR